MYNAIYITFDGSGGASTSDMRVRLSREYSNFDDHGSGRRFTIYRPNSGEIAGTYDYALTTMANRRFFDEMKPITCSGEFTLSGYKQYVTISINENCDGQIY